MKAKLVRVAVLVVWTLVVLFLSPMPAQAASCISAGSGNWSATGTWTNCNGGVPWAGDDVTIASGHTVTVDTNTASISSLTVNGILRFDNSGTGKSMTVTGDVAVNSGGTLDVATGGITTTHTLTIGGNLTNDGTFDGLPATERIINVTFSRDGNQTVSGSGATTRFNNITLNMGSSNANVLDVQSVITMASGGLTLNNGTFKLSSASTITPFSGSRTIASSAGYYLNHASAVSNWGSSGSLTVQGALTIANGTMTVGTATNNRLEIDGSASNVQISGGTLNVTGRWQQVSGGSSNTLNISGGAINVATAGQISNNTYATFRVPSGNNFTMNAGTVTIKNANSGNGGDLRITNSSASITGGTFVIGNGGATLGNIQVRSDAPLANLTIDAGTTSPALAANLTVNNTLTLTSGDLTTGSYTLTMGSGASCSGSTDVVGNVKRTDLGTTARCFGNPNVKITINSGTAPTDATINLSKSAPSGLTKAIQRVYALSQNGGSDLNATVQLSYTDAEVSAAGETEANLKLWRYNSGTSRWELQGGTVDTNNNFVSVSGVSSLSNWAIASSGTPTAVTLSSLTARADTPEQGALAILPLALAGALGAGVWLVLSHQRSVVRRK